MSTARSGSTERRRTIPLALSPSEAAFVAEVPQKTVNQAIDRCEVKPLELPARRKRDRSRALGESSLLYLRLRKEVGDFLTAKGKRALSRSLEARDGAPPAEIEIGPLRIPTRAAWRRVLERVALVRRARAAVATNPEVRGGEPVVRGTRIPVYLLADFVKRGETPARLLEDYPALTEETLEGALLYARLHPRRGRPKAASWRERPPGRVYRPEELGHESAPRSGEHSN